MMLNRQVRRMVVGAIAVCVMAAAALAQPDGARGVVTKPVPTLTVSGRAVLEAPADEVRISLSVLSEGGQDESAKTVVEENSKKVRDVLRALKKMGLGDDELETARFNVSPIYAEAKRGKAPQIVGYRVENIVNVKTQKLKIAGDILQEAIEAGVNRVHRISFGLADERTLRAEAIRQAAQHARDDASVLAEASGVGLVRTLNVELDQPQFRSPQVYTEYYDASTLRAAASRTADSAPPMEAGDVTVTATVRIVYEIGELEEHSRAGEAGGLIEIDAAEAMRLLAMDERRRDARAVAIEEEK